MSELINASHIDIAIHLGYDQKYRQLPSTDPSDPERFASYRRRALILSLDPHSIMFYISAYLNRDPDNRLIPDRRTVNQQAFLEDTRRIEDFQEMLGDRFFLFGEKDHLTNKNPGELLKFRGYTYDPSCTTIMAYGEYYGENDGSCVNKWLENSRKALKIPSNHCQIEADLCLHSPQSEEDFIKLRTSLSAADESHIAEVTSFAPAIGTINNKVIFNPRAYLDKLLERR